MTDSIVVVSTGAASVAPDTVQANVAVEYEGSQVAQVLAQLKQGSQAALDTFREMGIPEAQITSDAMNVSSYNRGEPEGISYHAGQTFTVRMDRLEQLGELLPRLGESVGNGLRVNSMGPIASKADSVVASAREAAFAGAKEQAEHLAVLAGRTLGKVLSVRPGDQYGSPMPKRMMLESTSAGIPMAAGEQEVSVTIQVEFALEG